MAPSRPRGRPAQAGTRWAYEAAYRMGVHHLGRLAHRHQLLIVCYHGIRPDGGADWPESWLLLPREEFERQLRYLSRRYRVLPIDEALIQLRAHHLEDPTVCITFDDGYRNNRSVALPVLESLGLPATVYLATGLVGTQARLWTTELELEFRASTVAEIDLGPLGLGRIELNSSASRQALARGVLERLKRLSPRARMPLLRQVRAGLQAPPVDDGGAFEFLDWSDVTQMESGGLITFGAHTVGHEILRRLDDDSLEVEVGHSVAAVRNAVRHPSRTFAYPNGTAADFDERAERAVARAGCIGALTTLEGLNRTSTSPFALRRVVVGGRLSIEEFVLQCAGLPAQARRMLGRKPATDLPPIAS